MGEPTEGFFVCLNVLFVGGGGVVFVCVVGQPQKKTFNDHYVFFGFAFFFWGVLWEKKKDVSRSVIKVFLNSRWMRPGRLHILDVKKKIFIIFFFKP